MIRTDGWNALLLGILITAASSSNAQQPRTFVSSRGNDINSCTPAAPCRTFERAQSSTAVNGEIIALDSGGYGPVTLTKSIHLTAVPGAYVGITATSNPGISINAPASARISLRRLIIVGMGSAYGIHAAGPASLDIEDCHIRGMSTAGIYMYSPGVKSRLTVIRSSVTDSAGDGVQSWGGNAGMDLFIADCYFAGHQSDAIKIAAGVIGASPIIATISSSVLEESFQGINVAADNISIYVAGCQLSDHSVAIRHASVGIGRVSDCYITNNTTAMLIVGGNNLVSFGNNKIVANGGGETFSSTLALK